MRELRRLLICLGYFTRLPVPAWVGWSSTELNRAARYFPFVGLVVGGFGAAILWGCWRFVPPGVAVILSMVSTLLVTGAFHEDGLADSADGFGGGWKPDQILSIMKDSRIGSYGAITLGMALLSKFVLLQALGVTAVLALPIVHAASRVPPLLIMSFMRYVRNTDNSRAKPVAEGLGATEWITGTVLGLAPLLILACLGYLSVWRTVSMLLVLIIVGAVCARYFYQRIGGYTGDALGAAQQACELTAYLVLSVHLTT